jgi:integrase/recombinase XerD
MKAPKSAVEINAFHGVTARFLPKENSLESVSFHGVEERKKQTINDLMEDFLEYARYEINFSPQTIIKYRDSLRCFIKDVGDKPVDELEVQDFVKLKRIMMERGVSGARISSVVYAMRSFLFYCRDFLKISTLNPKQIRPPKRLKREVIFLTKEEIERFIKTIDLSKWYGFRFRVLVEVSLGAGMRE